MSLAICSEYLLLYTFEEHAEAGVGLIFSHGVSGLKLATLAHNLLYESIVHKNKVHSSALFSVAL